MTIDLAITPEQRARLEAEADRIGVSLAEYAARRLLGDPIPDVPARPTEKNGSVAELFAQWREEDRTDDLEELERRDAELAELKSNLNANRALTGEGPLFPRST